MNEVTGTIPAGGGARASAGGGARAAGGGPGSAAVRAEFPVLSRTVRGGKPLIYLDSAATSQKPQVVLDAMDSYYRRTNAAVHRGAHKLAEEATDAFENARAELARFIGANADELVVAPSATTAINMLAYALSNASQLAARHSDAANDGARLRKHHPLALGPGDEICVTEAEHHANLVPWQELAGRTGATLRWIPLGPDGRLETSALDTVVTERTRVVAFGHASNVTGALADVPAFVAAARRAGAITVLDAAQTAPHLPLDVHALGVDAAVVAGHKMYGPLGIGLLYVARPLLGQLPPVLMGGSMVEVVTMTKTTYLPPPARFEAGTQPVAEAVGLAAAARYIAQLGWDAIGAHDQALTSQLVAGLRGIAGVRLLGPGSAEGRVALAAVAIDGVHPHDAGQLLDDAGIAVRVGHHCAQPAHRAFSVHASTRASLGVYNTAEEVDAFLAALAGVRPYFGVE